MEHQTRKGVSQSVVGISTEHHVADQLATNLGRLQMGWTVRAGLVALCLALDSPSRPFSDFERALADTPLLTREQHWCEHVRSVSGLAHMAPRHALRRVDDRILPCHSIVQPGLIGRATDVLGRSGILAIADVVEADLRDDLLDPRRVLPLDLTGRVS